tara:strand:- start:7079 stop:7576 length:498 start_codon:yes stop_codon:yes gene_type:complete
MVSIPYLIYQNIQNDLQTGQTSYYVDYGEAKDYWAMFIQRNGGTAEKLGMNVQLALLDMIKSFEASNKPKTALEFWLYSKEYMDIILGVYPNLRENKNFSDFLNIINLHIDAALGAADQRKNADLFVVIDKTIDKTVQDTKKQFDPKQSLLPWVIAGVVLIALTR